MSNNLGSEAIDDVADRLQSELMEDFGDKPMKPQPAITYASLDRGLEQATRLPRKIAGGFKGLGQDLDTRARDLRNMVRLLEQQRPVLEAAEGERDRLHQDLTRVVPEVQESARAVATLIASTKNGDVSGDLAGKLTRNLAALDELESVASALTANALVPTRSGPAMSPSAWRPRAPTRSAISCAP